MKLSVIVGSMVLNLFLMFVEDSSPVMISFFSEKPEVFALWLFISHIEYN